MVDRLVPGLLREKVTLLLKSLPKSLRRQLVPVPDYAERCLQAMPVSDAPLVQVLGATLKKLTGIHIPGRCLAAGAVARPPQAADARCWMRRGGRELAARAIWPRLQKEFAGTARAMPLPRADGEGGGEQRSAGLDLRRSGRRRSRSGWARCRCGLSGAGRCR